MNLLLITFTVGLHLLSFALIGFIFNKYNFYKSKKQIDIYNYQLSLYNKKPDIKDVENLTSTRLCRYTASNQTIINDCYKKLTKISKVCDRTSIIISVLTMLGTACLFSTGIQAIIKLF